MTVARTAPGRLGETLGHAALAAMRSQRQQAGLLARQQVAVDQACWTGLPEAVELWEAEDGRCEACGRPMDKTCARTGHDTRGDRRRVCPDCKDQGPDPLATAMVGAPTAEHVATVLGTTTQAAATWLADGSRVHGVLVRCPPPCLRTVAGRRR